MATNPWAKPASPDEETQTAEAQTPEVPAAPTTEEIPPAPVADTEVPVAPVETELVEAPAGSETTEIVASESAPAPVVDTPVAVPDVVVVPAPVVPEAGKVTAIIPKNFNLTLDDMTVVNYKAGTRDIPVEHAEHWYAKANGVKIYTGQE